MSRPGKVVDAGEWFGADGGIPMDPPARFRDALRIAQCIEYGGPLPRNHLVLTLISCRRRPGNQACRGVLYVIKNRDDELVGLCDECRQEDFIIINWQDTPWAGGPQRPMPLGEPTSHGVELPADVRAQLEAEVGPHGIAAASVVDIVAMSESPNEALQRIARLCQPRDLAAAQRLADAVMNTWNHTPRDELDGRTPNDAHHEGRRPAMAEARPGRNDPCACGSGKQYKHCCLH